MNVVVLTKRQYTNRDVIDDRYGRLWEIPIALAREGHTVTCLCLSYRKRNAGSEVYDDTQGHAIRWVSVNLGIFAIFGILKYLYVANKLIRKERPDFIWSCSDTIYNVLGHYFSALYKCHSIVDLYDNFESFASYRVPILRSLFRKAVRDSSGVSCVSECLKRHIVATYDRIKPTAIITNAVDTSMFRPMDKAACRDKLGLPQDIVLVGTAGAMSTDRGAHIMFQANEECAAELAGVHFAVAGYRPAGTQVPKAENVYDFGLIPVGEVPVLLNSLDLAVVFNRKTPFGEFCFPQKFYEILACGIPIVAANVGEMRLLLEDSPHLLYQEENVQSFVSVVKEQLVNRQRLDLGIPTWHDQALLLEQLMHSASTNTKPESQAS